MAGRRAVEWGEPRTGPSPGLTESRPPLSDEPTPPPGFPTTRWSRVAHAVDPDAPEARAALAELCAAYWFPLYALNPRRGPGPDEALGLTQDYFARPLEAGVLA